MRVYWGAEEIRLWTMVMFEEVSFVTKIMRIPLMLAVLLSQLALTLPAHASTLGSWTIGPIRPISVSGTDWKFEGVIEASHSEQLDLMLISVVGQRSVDGGTTPINIGSPVVASCGNQTGRRCKVAGPVWQYDSVQLLFCRALVPSGRHYVRTKVDGAVIHHGTRLNATSRYTSWQWLKCA